MDLSTAPTEIVWKILDSIPNLEDRKQASLVRKSWNQMLLTSRKNLDTVNLRICTRNRGRSEDVQMFRELYTVMIASNRNYVNVEFFCIDFSISVAVEFLYFIAQVCRSSIKRLKFVSCTGLSDADLWDILGLIPALEELSVLCQIESSCIPGMKLDVPLPNLRKMAIHLDFESIFYREALKSAPNLEEIEIFLSIYPHESKIGLVDELRPNLKKFSYNAIKAMNVYHCCSKFTNLVELHLDLEGTEEIGCHIFDECKRLRSLELAGNISDGLICAISQISTLEHLKIFSKLVFQTNVLYSLTALSNLESLQLNGFYAYTWENVFLPKLRKLHVGCVGSKFIEFLKRTPALENLEIHDEWLGNKSLKRICHNVPKLKRLELAYCDQITDGGLNNIGQIRGLVELRLWGIEVPFNVFKRWRYLPLRKLLIFFSKTLDEDSMEEIGTRLLGLKQAIFYDCYNVSEEAFTDLRLQIPSCEVLEIYRGYALPPALRHETQLYQRNAQFPQGVLRTEMPFEWL